MKDQWDEWTPEPDGRLAREAARVIVIDGQGRVLLQRAHDVGEVERHWWFTPGGGIAPGEDARRGALRELAEETGIRLGPQDLIGPIARRNSIFDFAERHLRQYEVYFLAYVTTTDLDESGWTDWERQLVDGQDWLTPTQIAALPETVYPLDLLALLENLRDGWDGTVWQLDK